MKTFFLSVVAVLIFSLTLAAQKFEKPTLEPADPTPEQSALIDEAVELHDEGKFDEAIGIYERILRKKPNCALVIYEIALSYYAKKDYPRALEYLTKGARYKSEYLPYIYRLTGSVIDDSGQPSRALEIYRAALEQFPEDAVTHYDMGVTLSRVGRTTEARDAWKKSVTLDFRYLNVHYSLAENFYKGNYRLPSMFALGRFLSLENGSERTQFAARVFRDILRGSVQRSENSKEVKILLNSGGPKDEGDFTTIELVLSMISAAGSVPEKKDKAPKTDEEQFLATVESLVSFVERDTKNASTFVGKNYFPFFVEMKKRGYLEPFSYVVLQQTGSQAAEKWIVDNSRRTIEFFDWAKAYQPGK